MSRKKIPKIDPELLRQMRSVVVSTGEVQAVFKLRLSPEETTQERVRQMARVVLRRAESVSGEKASRVNVLTRFGIIVLSATPFFINALLAQPGILSAVANRQNRRGRPSAKAG